jgi:hypothetical protein
MISWLMMRMSRIGRTHESADVGITGAALERRHVVLNKFLQTTVSH